MSNSPPRPQAVAVRLGRTGLPRQRLRHHVLAARVAVGLADQGARHRDLEAVGRMARHAPAARPAREIAPIFDVCLS